jgi:hypothetical protein
MQKSLDDAVSDIIANNANITHVRVENIKFNNLFRIN